jgi:hypothetical protein
LIDGQAAYSEDAPSSETATDLAGPFTTSASERSTGATRGIGRPDGRVIAVKCLP